MPAKDRIHELVKQALLKDGWQITDDPYVISYGERFLFVVCIEYDGIEPGIIQDLIDRGIAPQQIIHTFLPEAIAQP
jgi:hypothetical protein